MHNYLLAPIDTLFFRDGSPFNLGETGQMEVKGGFPPHPTSIVGALRAILARHAPVEDKWAGVGKWSDAIENILGNYEDLKTLRFQGPYLFYKNTVLFPTPLQIVQKTLDDGKKSYITCLLPSKTFYNTDLGKEVHLPTESQISKAKSGSLKRLGGYLKGEQMALVLKGQLPQQEQIISELCLWHSEDKIGIKRNEERTTSEDSLYQIQHSRLQMGVSLGVSVEGLSDSWGLPDTCITTLGGEARMVEIVSCQENFAKSIEALKPDKLVDNGDHWLYTVTLITPADFNTEKLSMWQFNWNTSKKPLTSYASESIIEEQLAILRGEVVSACLGKPILIGGWNSIGRRPLDLKPCVPAGSTWFLKAAKAETNGEDILKQHGKHIGLRTEWGYGQILIGTWPKEAL